MAHNMSEEEYERVRGMVEEGQCPVCVRKFGKLAQRTTVRNHLRESKQADHVVWRAKYYHIVFARGRYCYHPRERGRLVQELRDSITEYYGATVLHDLAVVG